MKSHIFLNHVALYNNTIENPDFKEIFDQLINLTVSEVRYDIVRISVLIIQVYCKAGFWPWPIMFTLLKAIHDTACKVLT